MSAETLRRAAAAMRERAEAATQAEWRAHGTVVMSHSVVPFGAKYVADCYDEPTASEADAAHIASWHPAVALAVADWLDAQAALDPADVREDWPCECQPCESVRAALAVARTYLGEQP